ncbi:MAG: hypothetical protein K0S51_498 [Bacillales bacterium]|jgi:uncharacterized protein YktA (UPF0223 family)|nr:hypothetical protein [Bacillales bacterium]
MSEYTYPINYSWSTDELIIIVKFYEVIEKAYESGVNRKILMDHYRNFKTIVNSISEEKKIDKEFQEVSGYSIYKVIKKAKESDDTSIIKG